MHQYMCVCVTAQQHIAKAFNLQVVSGTSGHAAMLSRSSFMRLLYVVYTSRPLLDHKLAWMLPLMNQVIQNQLRLNAA